MISKNTVLQLGVSQTLYYSAFYYIFPATLLHVLQDRDLNQFQYNLGFSIVLLSSGISAPFIGKLVDRHKGPIMIACSGMLGGMALICMTLSDILWFFYAGCFVIGLASAMGQYEVCFGYLGKFGEHVGGNAIILVTLMAGFASTITFPAVGALASLGGWKLAYRVFGLAAIATGILLLRFLVKSDPMRKSSVLVATTAQTTQFRAPSGAGKRLIAVLIALTLSNALVILAGKTVHTQVLMLMGSLQLPASTGILIASSIGPMQVLGRLCLLAFSKTSGIRALFASAVALAALVLGAVLLTLSAQIPGLVIGFVLLHGMAMGSHSVLSPLVKRKVFGAGKLGFIIGISALFTKLAGATAPAASSWAALAFGYSSLPIALILVALTACAFYGMAMVLCQRFH